jgi:hypothetical protein
MLGAMILDFASTLLGQPGSFWRHPETMHEANQLVRLFLGHGWMGYFLFDLIDSSGAFLLVSILPRMIALVCFFAFMFGSFLGASNWFFYEWRMGMETPVIYGVLVSVIIVLLAFSRSRENAT